MATNVHVISVAAAARLDKQEDNGLMCYPPGNMSVAPVAPAREGVHMGPCSYDITRSSAQSALFGYCERK